MTIVMKKETTLELQLKTFMAEVDSLKRKIAQIQKQNKSAAHKNAIIWTLILGLPLFFLFPVFHLIIWFSIFYTKYNKGTKEYKTLLNYKLKELDPIKKGFTGEAMVTKVLVNGLSDQFILLNDVSVATKKGSVTQIDHLLICPNGKIVCIETKHIKGKFYPHKNGWAWYPTDNYTRNSNGKHVINSPQNQSIYHAEQLKYNLNNKGYKLDIEPIVVLTHRDSDWKGTQAKCRVLSIVNLLAFSLSNSEVQYNSFQLRKIADHILSLDKTPTKAPELQPV